MKKKILALGLVATMTAALFAGCTSGGGTDTTKATDGTKAAEESTTAAGATDLSALAGTYDITVWVSESDGVADLTQQQIARFCEENEGIVINATVEGVTEADSASKMITDVESGADLYCFAQDQLSRLVEAGALVKLGTAASETVTNANDTTSVSAASVGNELYCYPLTSDNGYFMFYDSSVIPAEDVDSLEAILADCEAAGKMFSMELETSAWYLASFFFGTGCVSDWTTDTEGTFTSVNDTFNSDNGLIAMKGIQKVVTSTAYTSSSATADFAAAVPSAVVVSGTWGSAAAKEALGDNYAVADLPSFEVDGKSYHLGSYSGCKLMGVKPQSDATKTAVLQQLALYLTNATCQLERFNLVGWGPSNVEAQKDDAVAADAALVALAAQNQYATPQGNIHGSWWDDAKVLGTAAKEATSDDDLKAALETYEKTINAYFERSAEELSAMSIIGAFGGYNWDTDVTMTEDPEGTWTVTQEFKAGDEFKIRQGASWDVNFGVDGEVNGANIVIEEDGTYLITLVYDGTTASVTVEKQ